MEIYWWPHFSLGVALCLAGWCLYWLSLHVGGGVVGGALLGVLGWLVVILLDVRGGGEIWVPLGAAFLGFLLGIFLARKAHRLAFFCMGGCLGLAAVWHGFEPAWHWYEQWRGLPVTGDVSGFWQIVAAVLGLVAGGLLMLAASRVLVALVTSLVGALLIALAFPDPLALLLVPVVGLGCFLFQLGVLRRFFTGHKREEAEA